MDESINSAFQGDEGGGGSSEKKEKTPNCSSFSHSPSPALVKTQRGRGKKDKSESLYGLNANAPATYVTSVHFPSPLVVTLGAPREEPAACFSLVCHTPDIDKHHSHRNTAGHFELADSARFSFVVICLLLVFIFCPAGGSHAKLYC